MPVHAVGKVARPLRRRGHRPRRTRARRTRGRSPRRRALLAELGEGLVFVNLVETDQVYGHRKDVEGFHGALRAIDAAVGGWLERAARRATCSSSPPTTAATRPRRTPTTRASTSPLLARFAGHGRPPPRRRRWPTSARACCAGSRARTRPALPGTPFVLRPRCPSCPRSRRSAAGSRPLVEGRTLRELEILDPRWCEPLAPRRSSTPLEGRAIERLGRRGKYLVSSATDEVFLAHAPAHDGHAAARPARPQYVRVASSSTRVASHLRLDAEAHGPVVSFCDPRRFGTGELALGGAARDAFLDARLGLEPLGARLHRRSTCGRSRAAAAPRSRRSCSTSGGSPAWGTSTPTRRCSARASTRCAPAGGSSVRSRRAARRGRRRRSTPASRAAARRSTTSATRRRQGRVSARVPRPPPRGRAVPGVRRRDPQVRRRRARDLRVRALPAAPPTKDAQRGFLSSTRAASPGVSTPLLLSSSMTVTPTLTTCFLKLGVVKL